MFYMKDPDGKRQKLQFESKLNQIVKVKSAFGLPQTSRPG